MAQRAAWHVTKCTHRSHTGASGALRPYEKTPGSGPVYWLEAPKLVIVTPKIGASASHTSLNGRFEFPPVCPASEPPVTSRKVPPFTLVFFPPKMMSGIFCWL